MFRDLRELVSTRVLLNIFVAGVLSVAGHAQEAAKPTSVNPPPPSTANSTPPSERVVLKVGDTKITQAAFEKMISVLEQQQGPADISRKTLGDNFASLIMLAQQATANHLDTSPEVIEQLSIDRTQILSNAEFARLKAEAKPTPQEISAYYNSHPEDFETVQVRRLFVWIKPEGAKDGRGLSQQEATALVAAIQQATAAGSDTTALVAKYNNDTVVFDVQPLTFQRGEMPPAMEKAAFSLTKPGQWIQLDKTPENLVYLELIGRGHRELKDMSASIEKKLQAQKLRAELDELKQKWGVWMDETYFASNTTSPPEKSHSDASGQSKTGREDKDADKQN